MAWRKITFGPICGLISPLRSCPVQSPLTEQQQQFCVAFQEDGARRKEFASKVAASGNNPIAARLAEKDKPNFDRLFQMQQFAVMGGGGFQNWFGHVTLTVNRNQAYVEIQFPCAWTAQDELFKPRHDSLYLGNGFGEPFLGGAAEVYRDGVRIDSPAGEALAALSPGEAVTATGILPCPLPSGFKGGGCEIANGVHPELLWAKITSIRSLKTGVIYRLADVTPTSDDFDRVNALRKAAIRFYQSDDRETMREKARALVWQKPSSESVTLLEYLYSPERCNGCLPANTLVGIPLQGYDLDASGQRIKRQKPCPPNVRQPATCMEEIVAFVESDMPALRDVGTIAGSSFVPGPNGRCYLVSQEDQYALQHRMEKLDGLLQPLGLRLEPSSTPSEKMPNVCEPLNLSVKNEKEVDVERLARREQAFGAAAVSVTADEFEARLREAVKTRAVSLGADASQYDNAIRTVSSIVRLCASISEAEFAESMDQFNQPHLVRYKDGKYKECVPTGVYRPIPEAEEQPGVLIRHDLRDHWDPGQKRWSDVKFHIDVFLKPVPGHKTASLNEAEALLIAMSADVSNAGSATAPKYVCTGARLKQNFTGAKEVTVTLTASTKITQFIVGGSGMVTIRMDGFDGSYTIPGAMVKNFCPGSPEGLTAGVVGAPGLSASPIPIATNEQTVKLTPGSPVGERDTTIVAPGTGAQNFSIYYIDTLDFIGGGILEIEIQIARDSATDGSFDLFPSNVRIPTRGNPTGTLVGRYDVRRGTTTRLEYRFSSGQLFALGLEGNWFSPKGAMGRVHFRASVRR